MCEADLSSADQVVIFKGDLACLQTLNLTAFTTGDLVFIGGTKLSIGCPIEHPNVHMHLLNEHPSTFEKHLTSNFCIFTIAPSLMLLPISDKGQGQFRACGTRLNMLLRFY